MNCKIKWYFVLLLSIVLFFFFNSCKNNNLSGAEYVKNLRGKRIVLEDTMDVFQNSKILILVPDTGDCMTCAMQVYDWYIYKLDLEKHKLECEIIYILDDSVKINKNVANLINRYNLHQVSCLSLFYAKNPILKDAPFTTFLVDKNNKIELLGSPIDNESLWILYKKVLAYESVSKLK